jgi:hypothetical protein
MDMGLTFTVGNPSDAFLEPFAEKVRAALAHHFGAAIDLSSSTEPYFSAELAWSGWRQLQERAASVLKPQQVPHLLSMEAWSGCYVPCDTEPGTMTFEGEQGVDVASLDRLLGELEAIGAALDLPTDDQCLLELAAKYEEGDLIDEDEDIQTYVHLLLTARVARDRRQVLWIVK